MAASFLYGQNSGVLSLSRAIGDIEDRLEKSSLSGTERRGAFEGLARLYHLSGDMEGAAKAWTDAAFAEPGYREDGDLLEGAACFIALGEMDKAEASVQTVLLTGRDEKALFKARYLEAQLAAFKSADTSALIALIDNPGYGEWKPAIYYTLWEISGAGTYKSRLLAEYPQSPEARILRGDEAVNAGALALWLLFPGREGISLGTPSSLSSEGSSPIREPEPEAPNRRASPENLAPDAGGTALQTGLFSREENARAMAERLKAAGFEARLARRVLEETVYWAVNVSPGPDINQTIRKLKEEGFESFPVK
ncbi:MAG: SPOR domain-containing protein [Treponema sp.]|nr:SPOR domain-containing protein [Treponema sp.]